MTPVLHFIGLLFGGAGHGTLLVEYILFPFYTITAWLSPAPNSAENAGIIFPLFATISFFQYVFYAILLTIAEKKGKLNIAIVAISILHISALIVGAFISSFKL